MTASDMARKLKGMADSDRNNLNHQDRMFLKEVAKELMHGRIIQNGTNNTAKQMTEDKESVRYTEEEIMICESD